MPTYVYICEKCGELEVRQSIREAALTTCPHCGRDVRRVISGGTNLMLKSGASCSIAPSGGG